MDGSKISFLLGWRNLAGAMLVSGRVYVFIRIPDIALPKSPESLCYTGTAQNEFLGCQVELQQMEIKQTRVAFKTLVSFHYSVLFL